MSNWLFLLQLCSVVSDLMSLIGCFLLQLRCVISDLTSDWRDGRMFCLLLHLYVPEHMPVMNLSEISEVDRLKNAFNLAESRYGL